MKINQHQIYRLRITKNGELIAERQKERIIKRKYTIRETDWIYTLKKGEYTIRDIMQISGSNNKTALLQKMIKYGARIENIFDEKRKIVKNLIIWDGYKDPQEQKGA